MHLSERRKPEEMKAGSEVETEGYSAGGLPGLAGNGGISSSIFGSEYNGLP